MAAAKHSKCKDETGKKEIVEKEVGVAPKNKRGIVIIINF
jgi:hypothetical protein